MSNEEKLQALCREIYDGAPSWCFQNGRSRGDMCSEPEYGNALQAIEKLFEKLGLELLPRPGPVMEEY